MTTRSSNLLSRRGPLALLIGAIAVIGLAACSTGGSPGPAVTVTKNVTASPPPAQSTAPSTPPPTTTHPTGKPVHIKTLNADGQTYGVAMPIIAYLSRKITDASTLVKDTKVTVDGKPLAGAWYFERTTLKAIKDQGYPIEAHWRPQHFWPAHSRVHVDLPMKGESAGTGLVYDDSLTLDFTIGARHIVHVIDGASPHLSVTVGHKHWHTFPVSLGSKAAHTPTLQGTKVIMEKLKSVCMSGNPPNAPAYHECGVKWDQRLTYGGEYLHAAPWNCTGHPGCTGPANNIGHSDSSNGCTNLRPRDAEQLYKLLRIGDPVLFPNANGPQMQLTDGYAGWNIPWSQWLTGGLISTT